MILTVGHPYQARGGQTSKIVVHEVIVIKVSSSRNRTSANFTIIILCSHSCPHSVHVALLKISNNSRQVINLPLLRKPYLIIEIIVPDDLPV